MNYIVVDAMFNGTGIRDKYNGGYLNPDDLGLSNKVLQALTEWLKKYEDEHYNGFENNRVIDKLDSEGRDIALAIKNELVGIKVEYFSNARMHSEPI